ncbi:MAG TPA: sulfite exporter TauE/SafE family protein [Thermococcus sp.]|nr:sulfite exporter TauE/SafE family protein [Thermococcus sp.]
MVTRFDGCSSETEQSSSQRLIGDLRMFDLFIVLILLAAFMAALIDTSLGMCYGTILAPILLMVGYSLEVVVPTILFSQLIVDIGGGLTHTKVRNFTRRDLKVALLVAIPATIFVSFGVFLNINLPKIITKTYVGLIVTILGLLLLLGIKLRKTSNRLVFISSIAGFNKGFMGGGFGPVVVSGQMVLNHDVRPSVAIGDIAEIPVCIAGLLAFAVLGNLSLLPIYLIVTVPALVASLIGPHITMKIGRKNHAEKVIGGTTITLGLITLLKIILTEVW